MGLEGFAMGLGTRRAPLTAQAPARNKGQHLFGGGGQRHAQGPWHGCLTAGHRWQGASGTAAGEALVLGVCGECSGGSEPKHGLVLPEEQCPQGRMWGEPG